MNKFKFSFKIKELELQVEGTREDAQAISTSIGKQFADLLQPAGALGEGQMSNPPLHITEDGEISDVRTSQRKRRTNGGGPRGEKAKTIDFKNDPAKNGAPLQSWSTLEKALWLLYVVQSELTISELSASEVAETFNKHFKQQGKIRPSNISRDFGTQKAGAKALVGENNAVTPAKWYLTEEGTKAAQRLIQVQKADN